MNTMLGIVGSVVILITGLTSVWIFRAFKAFIGALDNFVEKYVPKKDSITIEITREWVESFAEEFGYVVIDYDRLMKIIRKHLTSSGFLSSALPNCGVGGLFTDIMVTIFSLATEERVVFNTLENTFSTMLKNNGSGDGDDPNTDTVFGAEKPVEYVDKIKDHLKENKIRAESGKSKVDQKMLLRRG